MARNQDLTRLFGSIARSYDLANHTLSLGLDYYWRRVLARSLRQAPPGLFMDVAAGTCDVSVLLTKIYAGRKVLALDPCLPMLRTGLRKINAGVMPVAGDAFRLPLPERSVSAITLSFGLRNMRPRPAALEEMFRVLVPGGRLSVLEFGGTKKNPGTGVNPWLAAYRFYLFKALPRIGGIISGQRKAYEYLAQSIAGFPEREELAAEMLAAGFERVICRSMSGGIVYLHCADKKRLE